MAIVGTFHITSSFKITDKVVITGDLIEGRVKAGDRVTFNANGQQATLKILSVETGRSAEQEKDFVGLLFS